MRLRCTVKHWRKTESNPYEFYGLDFSDGKSHEVEDKRKVDKLLRLGFFEEVKPAKVSEAKQMPLMSTRSNDKRDRHNGHNNKG